MKLKSLLDKIKLQVPDDAEATHIAIVFFNKQEGSGTVIFNCSSPEILYAGKRLEKMALREIEKGMIKEGL